MSRETSARIASRAEFGDGTASRSQILRWLEAICGSLFISNSLSNFVSFAILPRPPPRSLLLYTRSETFCSLASCLSLSPFVRDLLLISAPNDGTDRASIILSYDLPTRPSHLAGVPLWCPVQVYLTRNDSRSYVAQNARGNSSQIFSGAARLLFVRSNENVNNRWFEPSSNFKYVHWERSRGIPGYLIYFQNTGNRFLPVHEPGRFSQFFDSLTLERLFTRSVVVGKFRILITEIKCRSSNEKINNRSELPSDSVYSYLKRSRALFRGSFSPMLAEYL